MLKRLWNHHIQFQNIFFIQRRNPKLHIILFFQPLGLKTSLIFLSLLTFLFWVFHTIGPQSMWSFVTPSCTWHNVSKLHPCQCFIPLCGWIMFHCTVDHVSVIHSFIDSHLDYSHLLTYYELCCYKHSCTGFCRDIYFHLSWVDARSGVAGS